MIDGSAGPRTISRLAPTPSGYLHLGNAVNLLLTSWYVRAHGGQLALRIDDIDAERTRPEYVADIFRVLEWLEIGWDSGPSGVEDFYRNHSLAARTDYYRAELVSARAAGVPLYVCACSRSEVARRQAVADDVDPCAAGDRELRAGETALRVAVPPGWFAQIGDRTVGVGTLGDFVVWRRDDTPAYQWASVIEDRDLGTTALVRGVDLMSSSAAQIYLAGFIDAGHLTRAEFVHHDLVSAPGGGKLSKSTRSNSGRRLELDHATRRTVARLATTLGSAHGIADPGSSAFA